MPGGYANQARMTVASSGTTAFALSAAVQPFSTFANAGVIDQQVVPYGATDSVTNLAEKGWGLYSTTGSSLAGPSLTRNPFTNGGAAVSLSSSGTQVFIDPSVADLVQLSLAAHANLGGL
jgi:hypothetical protein